VHQRPSQLIVATEVLASGQLTRRDLSRRYTKLYRNVYVRNGVELTALDWAYAAWLWSGKGDAGRSLGSGAARQSVDTD
jgi:hypothetical protein